MKLLLIHPGASYSTHDVYVGLHTALTDRGHEVLTFALDQRIARSGEWIRWNWRKSGRPEPAPQPADIVYHASYEATERALYHEVDGVIAISGMYLHHRQLLNMRRAGIRTAIIFTESPYDDEPQAMLAPMVDVCFTNERSSVDVLRRANPRTFYLAHAYNPAQHHYLAEVPTPDLPEHDVVFVGTSFWERVELLRAVDWTGIDLGLYGVWNALGSRNKLRQYIRGDVVDNKVAADLYRRAKIGLNLHRLSRGFGRGAPRIEHAESLNPRAYELAACGVFQISDYRAEVHERFGAAVPTFRDAAELERLIRQYLADPRARRSMAVAARSTVSRHTFAERAAQIEEQLAQGWAIPIAKGA